MRKGTHDAKMRCCNLSRAACMAYRRETQKAAGKKAAPHGCQSCPMNLEMADDWDRSIHAAEFPAAYQAVDLIYFRTRDNRILITRPHDFDPYEFALSRLG